MSELKPLQYVNVGPHGTFKPSGKLHTTPADIDKIFAHIEQNQIPKLAIHFHGGLIKEEDGIDIAKKMNDLYQQAGSHPVSFIWETGPFETIRNNLTSIHKTKLAKKLLKYVIRQAAKRLGGGIGNKGPGEAMTLAEIEAELAKESCFDEFNEGARRGAAKLDEAALDEMTPEIETELEEDLAADEELSALLEKEAPETELLDQAFVKEVETEGAKGIATYVTTAKALAMVTLRVLKRYIDERDHDIYPTVVEELLRELYAADLGKWVWDGMKSVAKDMWEPNAGPIGEKSHAGTYFLEKLAAWQKKNPNFTVDIVGHSAGAIAICHMLAAAAARHPDFRARNILFLAPGCTMNLFHDQVVTKPERYQAFRMFAMYDLYEKEDHLLGQLYTRSLLYFVSGVLEDEADKPLTGLERHMSGQAPYADKELVAVREFLYEPGQSRLVLSKTKTDAPPGLQSEATQHGIFDDEEKTRNSLKFIIAS